MRLDSTLLRALHHRAGRWPLFDLPTTILVRFGSLIGVVLLLASARLGRRGLRAIWRSLLALVEVYISSELLGALARRPRPFATEAEVRSLGNHPPGRSFPSRHVASAACMAVVVGGVSGRLGWLLITLATVLGLSRVRAGLHYPSDLAAGAALGIAIGLLHRLPRDARRAARPNST